MPPDSDQATRRRARGGFPPTPDPRVGVRSTRGWDEIGRAGDDAKPRDISRAAGGRAGGRESNLRAISRAADCVNPSSLCVCVCVCVRDRAHAQFCIAVLGDLHMDPRKMEDYEMGRGHWLPILEEGKAQCGDSNVALVSLGDLGESKV